MNILNSITIVGAGTAGLTTALILKKKFPRLDIKIIKSDKIGIIGVGEGSTDHWKEFMDYCDIGWEEIIKETDPVEKVMQKFKTSGAWNLPVVKDGKYIGFISKSKLLTAYRNKLVEVTA